MFPRYEKEQACVHLDRFKPRGIILGHGGYGGSGGGDWTGKRYFRRLKGGTVLSPSAVCTQSLALQPE